MNNWQINMQENNLKILYPVLSEKSNRLSEQFKKYVFKVECSSNKMEIKTAVEDKFNVKVKNVATMNVKGKVKNMTIRSGGHVIRTSGSRASWKKAIVTLTEGHSIDLVGSET